MAYNPRSTKYLLRFDDLCPTMNWKVWSEIENTLRERKLKPMLAVVPDNQDPALQVDPPVEDFWERVRGWQANGWPIGLHGYQHRYVSTHTGLVTLRRKSEFAGVPVAEQEEKLRRGTEILNREGILPQIWIAPGNSFDAYTVSLLPSFGISMICDGHFRFPFVCRRNLLWVPQQLFRFRPAPPGVWTVCYHHNRWTTADLGKFREDLQYYGAFISSLDEVVQDWAGRRSWWSAFCCTSPRFSPVLIRCQLKLISYWRSLPAQEQPEIKPLSNLQPR
jgi:Uncharacterized protein conserved in bacteria (DUF2334)